MQRKSIWLILATLTGTGLLAQQISKPTIGNITTLPSDPVRPTGNCKLSTAGYLEQNGRTSMTDKEVGTYVSSKLRDGYVITIYPETKNGIFVALECTNAMPLAKP